LAPGVDDRRFLRFALLIALVGTAQALLYLPIVNPHSTEDTPSYVADAKAILHGGYSIPLGQQDITGIDWPPALQHVKQEDTYRTPGYPAFLAVFGGGAGGVSRWAVLLTQALLIGAGVFLAALWLRRLFDHRVALVGAAAYALDPYSKRYASLVLAEAISGFLLMLGVYLFVRAWQERALRWWISCGLTFGVLTLVRPIFGLGLPLVALGALLRGPTTRVALRTAVVYCAAFCLVVVPWLGRTTAVMGSPALQNFGVGWGLLAAAHGEGLNHPWSEIVSSEPFKRDFYSVHKFAPTAAELRSSGDTYAKYLHRADKHQRHLAVQLFKHRLRHDPGRVLFDYAYRAYFLWMIHEDWVQPGHGITDILRTIDWIILALGIYGSVLAIRRGGAPAAGLVGLLAIYTLLSALGHVEARYTIPLRGIYLPFATLPLLALWDRRRARSGQEAADPDGHGRQVAHG
jgi:4-amino-4-deoxy-L-arabinose transferase-like glycosyltransferase